MESHSKKEVKTYFQHLLLLYKIAQHLKNYSYLFDDEHYNEQVFIMNKTEIVIQDVINSINKDGFPTHKYDITNKKNNTSVEITITTQSEDDTTIQFLTKIEIAKTCSMLISCCDLEIEFIKHIMNFQKNYLLMSDENFNECYRFTRSCFFLFKYNGFLSNARNIQEQIYATPRRIMDTYKDNKKELIRALAEQLISPITDKYLIDYDKNTISLSTQIDGDFYEQDYIMPIYFDNSGLLDERKFRHEFGKILSYYKKQVIYYEYLISEKFIS